VLYDSTYPFDIILDRILPKVFDNIEWFNLDCSIGQRILLSTKYPKLKTLILYISSLEAAIKLSAGIIFYSITIRKLKFFHLDKSVLFEQPIEILMIKTKFILPKIDCLDLSVLDKIIEDPKIFTRLFKQCCTKFQNLKYLNFGSFTDTVV
jgi:hypothetical protein